MKYAKLWMQVAAAIVMAVVASMQGDNSVSSVEWVNVAIVGIGAAGVFAAPNIRGAKYTKFILSALAAISAVLASALTNGLQLVEIWQMAVAALGAVGVYVIPNAGHSPDAPTVEG